MKKLNLFSNLWRLFRGSQKDESSTRLRVDYVSFTSRLRVWHVLCSRMAAVFLMLLTLSIGNAWAEWTRVTSIAELTAGGTFIMGYEATAKSGVIVPLRNLDCNATTGANGYFNTGTTAGSSTGGTIKMDTVTYSAPYEIYISSPASGKINIQRALNGNFYGATSGGTTSNKGRLYTAGSTNETNLTPEWASETNNQFKLTAAVSGSYKYLKYNTGSPRFAFYNSAGEKIVFYKKDTKVDVMCAKGFGGNTSNSITAAGTDYSAVSNLVNTSGSTYAMQAFKGTDGQVKGNGSGAANFSCRNTSTHDGYYISKVTLTVKTGTIDGSTSGRSIVYFGTSAYANPNTTAPSGTATTAYPASSGQTTLTWTNSNTSVSHFILYNLKTANSAYCAEYANALVVEWTKKPACSDPTINTHPTGGATYALNAAATALSVSATKNGSGPALTYQWYSNTTDNNTTGTIIDGATSSSYTPPTTIAGTKYYYCIVSSGTCTATSNTASVTITGPVITVSQTSRAFGDRKVNGGPYSMTFTVSGSNLSANIGLAISGTNAGMFSLSKTSLTQSAGSVATTEITVYYSPTGAGSHTAQIDITSTDAETQTVSLSGTGKWEVTWNVNGETSTSLVANSEKPTFPDDPDACDATSTTFIGWATASWSGKLASLAGKTVHTSNSTMSAVTANGTTYYAVFAKATGGAGTVHTLTKSNTSWSGYTSSTQNDNQSATWSYYAGGVNNSGTYYWALNTNANNYNIGSPKFSQNVTAISIWVKNPAASARNVYICSSNETAQPTSGDLGSKSIPGSGEEEYSIDNLTGSFDQFYIYVSAPLNIKYVKVTVGGTTYSDYMTTCCDKNISWSAPTITGTGATITFNKTSPVATCAGTTTIQATLTLTAGYQATALSFSGGSVSVSPAISLPVNSTTTYTLTFAANTNATLTTTATIAAKPLSSISLSPTSGTVYVGQYAEFAITYDPTDILTKGTTLDGTPSYCITTGTTNTTLKITGGKAGASITEDKTETVTIKASADNTKKASVSITVKPLPYVSFVDNIHNKTDFGGLTDGKVTATIVANALVKTQKTPTHADLAEPATGNDCEKSHLHLIGWIESTWADEHPAATKSDIIAATAYFYAPNADIDVDAQKGKTYYAVWAIEE